MTNEQRSLRNKGFSPAGPPHRSDAIAISSKNHFSRRRCEGFSNTPYNWSAGFWRDRSGNSNNARLVGFVDVNDPVLYDKPDYTFSSWTIDGNHSSVDFFGARDELLVAPGINGGQGLSALTIFTVYRMANLVGDPQLTRPVGIGSIAGTQQNPGDHFNLASDPSIRKDNGQVGSLVYSTPIVTGRWFVRVSRMDANGIDEWFNTTAALNTALTDAGPAFTTANDDFYLGDLRAGITPVPGFGPEQSLSDFSISQVIVYNTSLDDQQVAGINEWIITSIPEPSTASLLAITITAARLRRHRKKVEK